MMINRVHNEIKVLLKSHLNVYSKRCIKKWKVVLNVINLWWVGRAEDDCAQTFLEAKDAKA